MHSIRELHLEEICNNCKQPHGNEIIVKMQNSTIYEFITCKNCQYEIVRKRAEEEFSNRFEFM